jgi:hypothetical protein
LWDIFHASSLCHVNSHKPPSILLLHIDTILAKKSAQKVILGNMQAYTLTRMVFTEVTYEKRQLFLIALLAGLGHKHIPFRCRR